MGFYYVSDEEYGDIVCESMMFHDCCDSIMKSTTEPGQNSGELLPPTHIKWW